MLLDEGKGNSEFFDLLESIDEFLLSLRIWNEKISFRFELFKFYLKNCLIGELKFYHESW